MTALDSMFNGQRSDPVTCAQAHEIWLLLPGEQNALRPILPCSARPRLHGGRLLLLGANHTISGARSAGTREKQDTKRMKTKQEKHIVVGETPTEPRLRESEFRASKDADRIPWMPAFSSRQTDRPNQGKRPQWVRRRPAAQ